MNRSNDRDPDLTALSSWAPELAKTFVSLASDIALVIDADGVIRNVAQGGAEPIAPAAYGWVGRQWIDTVSGETRPKIENLLKEVAATGLARRREVNHPLSADTSIPVAYTAIRLGENGPVLAVGRDLRTIAAIQQRYVESQQDMERGYWRARQAEARYRLLFQVATDAVVVLDAESLTIVEANQAAGRLFDAAPEQLQGRHASFAFEHHSRGAINELLVSARGSGQSGEIRARLQGTTIIASVAATPFRSDDSMRLLVRLRPNPSGAIPASLNTTLARLVDDASDGVVVTDSSGRILVANPAFLALVQLARESEVKGQPLMGWLHMADQQLATIIPKVRRDGVTRRIEAWVNRAHAVAVRVEISAALLTEGDQECIGFTVHPSPLEGSAGAQADGTESSATAGSRYSSSSLLHAGLEQVSAQLGKADLAVLVREATALAERHFLSLAHDLSNGDAAAAAELLGLSQDKLARLRREHELGSSPDIAPTPYREAPPC